MYFWSHHCWLEATISVYVGDGRNTLKACWEVHAIPTKKSWTYYSTVVPSSARFLGSTVVLHERGPLFRILGPPKQQVSNIFKKFQSAGRSLLMMHENLHFSKQILHNFFQNFLFSIPWKIHEKPLSFCQPFYWPWIFNLHFSLEPGIVEACNMAHLNPVSLKINLVGWNPPFMPLSWSKCEKNEFFQYFSRRWARCFRLEMSLENMF